MILETAEVLPQTGEVLPQIGEVLSEVDEVCPQCVETRGRRLAEVMNLSADLAYVAVCSTGKHPSGRGILLGSAEPPANVFQIVLTHAKETTDVSGAILAPDLTGWG